MSDLPEQAVVVGEISADQKSTAALVHFIGAFFGFWSGLIFWLINKDKPGQDFVVKNAKIQLNWGLVVLAAVIVLQVLTVILSAIAGGIGALVSLLILAVFIVNIVFGIKNGLAAQKGEAVAYPFTLNLIK